jgi:hypothetical protein
MKKGLLTIVSILIMVPLAFGANVLYPKKDAVQKDLTDSISQATTDLDTIKGYNKPSATQIEWALKKLAEIQQKQLKATDSSNAKKVKAIKAK